METILCEINWEYVIAILSLLTSLVLSIGTIISSNNSAKKERLINVITSNRVEWIQKFKNYVSKYLSLVSYRYDRKLPDDTSTLMDEIHEITAQIKLHLNFKGKADKQIADQLDAINSAYEKFLFLVSSNREIKRYMIPPLVIEYYQNQHNDVFNEFYKKSIENLGVESSDWESINKKLNEIGQRPEEVERIFKGLIQIIDKDLKNSTHVIKTAPQKLLELTQIYLKTEWERVKEEAESGNLKEFSFDEKFESYKISNSHI